MGLLLSPMRDSHADCAFTGREDVVMPTGEQVLLPSLVTWRGLLDEKGRLPVSTEAVCEQDLTVPVVGVEMVSSLQPSTWWRTCSAVSVGELADRIDESSLHEYCGWTHKNIGTGPVPMFVRDTWVCTVEDACVPDQHRLMTLDNDVTAEHVVPSFMVLPISDEIAKDVSKALKVYQRFFGDALDVHQCECFCASEGCTCEGTEHEVMHDMHLECCPLNEVSLYESALAEGRWHPTRRWEPHLQELLRKLEARNRSGWDLYRSPSNEDASFPLWKGGAQGRISAC